MYERQEVAIELSSVLYFRFKLMSRVCDPLVCRESENCGWAVKIATSKDGRVCFGMRSARSSQ